ncbi:ATPase [Vibrio nigripulchritudo]|uniref:ATP-binding protein n=1 Tax=Vibrio nigripulchritudo TaxID=28173 RepID=UPI00190B57FA|nr:HAMP domain-containing sensor histidine kinase [Vibrio nigripulchritudo]BCL68602.1 ATPase [Vibrio nigripulchritudo]BDU29932.1 ATPase [Vibrio nigripulchritudo]
MSKANVSLTRTVLKTALSWYLVALALVGALLLVVFEYYIQKRFDDAVQSQLHDLVAAAEVSPSGQLELLWQPNSPRFNQPLSGWYWQILGSDNQVLLQSLSLYSDLPTPLTTFDGEQKYHWSEFEGPLQDLRAGIQTIQFSHANQRLQFIVAGPVSNINEDVLAFAKPLVGILLLLAAVMGYSVFRQVRIILSPVRELSEEIAQIRQGKQSEIDRELPTELQDVVNELNSLLKHNSSILERSRLQASNLAHALKNPLSVLRNELQRLDTNSAEVMAEQLDKLSQNAQTHLSRARLAGSMNHLASQTNIAESLSDILFSMELLYKTKQLDLSFRCHSDLYFKGDQHDLEEVLGNIIDNACKWSSNKVFVDVSAFEYEVTIQVDDDGPGISDENKNSVFKPGQRLDETTEGTGLGLHIVQDVVMLYGGSVSLHDSHLGGARFQIKLPGGYPDEKE